jgi:hypothetical protein
MALALRDGVHFALVGDRTIFVDVSADRYFGLPSSLDHAFHRFLDPTPLSGTEENALQPLIDRRLLVRREQMAAIASPQLLRSPTGDLWSSRPTPVRVTMIGLALWSEMAVSLAYGGLSLRAIEVRLRRWRNKSRQNPSLTADMATYEELAIAFHRTAYLFRPADRCLIKALAFLFACKSRQLFPSLVVGVRTNPFTAHCWVQEGPVVVNDELERVMIFTPILVL